MSSDNASKSASNRSTPEGAPVAATSPKSRSRNDAVRMAELAMAATLARAEAEAQDLQETAEQQAATGVHKAMVESEQSETSVLLARDDREDKVSDSSGSSWVMAQAGQVQPEVRQASQTDCKTTSSDQCDDDKAAWWQTDSSWVKVGLGVGGAMLAAQLLKRDANEPPSELSTGLAAGPFKKNGMTLSYFGTSGLLLELSWDEQGMLTKTVRAALNGDVSILTSKVDTGTGLVDVVTGVEVDFANYTGTLMAVLWDKTDAVPVQFYDEVAGLIALEDTSLRAVTSIQKGPNYLAITPFTELALRKANVPAIDPANVAQITQLLNTPQRVTDINNANKDLSTALGVTDIVKVLPVALNDQAFGTSTDAQSKLYGEKLASLSRLVPGNLDGGIDKLLNTAPADVPAVIAASLQDYRDDNNPQNPTTPPEVTIVRPWINAAEGRTPVTLRGSSENANEGSVVRITVLKNGVVLATLKTEVDADGHWQVPMPGTLASLGVLDGETLTIRAYIDPDHPASVDARYDATPPAAPQAPADMLASDDSANDSDDLTSQIRPGFQIGALPEEGMTVELLVDGVLVEATYNAQTGVIQPAHSLADGGHRITYRYIDFAGNVGPEGAPLQIVVDSQAPQAPGSAPDLQAASDSGTSQSDNITSDQRPRFVVGAAPEQALTVELMVDGEVVSATWDANTGTLRPTEAMGHGSHTVAYRWVDAAGNASEAGPGLDVDIDTVAPGVRMANIDISADTGSSASDFVTRQSAQTVTGQVNSPLSQGDRVFGSVDGGATWQEVTSLVNANGQLTWNNVQLSAGQNTLQFKFRDAAGNESVISSQAYNLDTTPPGIRAFNIAISEDTGSFNNDFVTKQSVQTVSGRLIEAGQLVSLANGELLMGSSDGGLTWQDITSGVTGSSFRWNNATLSNGTNSLRFKVIDQAGNEGTVIAQNYTLDTVSPAAPETFSWATYPNGISSSSNSVSGSIGQVPFTYTLTGQNASPLNLNSSGNLANHSFFPTGFGVPNQTSIRNDYASVNTLTFDSPMSNLVLAFSSIGNPSTPVSINFPQPVEILWSTGYGNGPDVRVDVGTRSAATQITGWEGNMVVRFNGTVDQFVFNYLSNETYVNFAFGASVFDLLAPEQDTGIKSIDDNTQVTRPAFNVQNKPSDAVSAELLINGQLVAATFNATDNTLTPNLPLSDGVYQVSYRFIDLAGNASAGGSVTTVTIDTRAPVNTSLTTFTPDAIGGNYEPGTTLSLKVNGVSINANRLVLNATNGTWSFVPTQSELTQAGTGLLNKATSTFDLTATDLAGNETVASKTVSKDVFNAPYVKEFIPTDGGILANDSTGHATLNLVFSKAVRAGTGKIKLFDVSNDALVAEIDVTSNAVRIEGNDLYVTLPALSTGTRYYVTLDNGTFVDSAGQAYVGKSETGTAGWDFTGALASIAPDFVAQDDIVNANESAAVVRITGKVVSSVAVLEDILAGDLSVNVTVPQGAAAVTATLQSYNNQTGEFVFTVPAQAWANGNYGYTVSLHGSTGDAASVTASYNFANLAVDLLAPSGILGSIDAITDNQGQLQGNLISTPSLKLLESTFASSVTPVIKLTDTNVADLDLTKLSATMGGAWINNGSNTLKGITDVLYNTASTVYNSDRTSVTFWLQTRDGATGLTGLSKAIKVELKDSVTANGIELRVIDAAYKNYASTDLSFNWNNSGAPKQQGQVATSFAAGGYGLLGLEYVGDKISAAGGFSDDDTPSLTGSLTRALAQGERIAIDRTDGQGNTITVTGKAGLVVDGTTWIFNDGALVDGQYTYRVYVEDGAGNRTASSAARSITVDTQAPTVTVTAASLSQDTGISNTDRLTKVAVQTITGTLSAALGSGEKLMASLDGGTTFVDITSMVSGTSFNWAGATLPQGASSIRWQVVDAAGNTGPGWDLSVNLDTAGPDAPVTAPDLLAADDDGNSDSDNATSISKPRFVVGPLPSGTSGVELLVNGLPVTAQYDASTQTLTPALNLANGSNLISYRYIDAAGNSGVASPSLTLELQPLVREYVPLTLTAVFNKNSLSIAGLGDVNGDGFSDIQIEANRRSNSPETADLNFITGASSFTSPITALRNISSSLISRPNNIPAQRISRVSALGDINNDGLNDYAMTTNIDPYAGFFYEAAYINFGSSSSIASPFDFKIFSSRIGSGDGYPAGVMTAQAGDMNGDGFNDILVNFNHLGAAVISGGTNLQNITQLDVAQLNSPPTQALSRNGFNYLSTFQTVFGPIYALQRTSYTNGVGDFNGDGYADMALAHEGDTGYVIYGRSSASSKAMGMTSESSVLTITGLAPITYTESWLAYRNTYVARMPQYLGDINGDGYADFAFTNYGYDSSKGQLVVLFGGTNTKALSVQNLLDQPGQRGFVIRNADGIADDILGYSATYAGDVNGDGISDFAFAAPGIGANNEGRVYIVYGRQDFSNLSLADVMQGRGGNVLNGSGANMNLGQSLAFGGDINGDGLGELLIGSRNDGLIVLGSNTFSESKITQVGTSAADTLSDGGSSKTLIGGMGNDLLSATGVSVLSGGVGDDTFVIGQAMALALQSPLGLGGNTERLAKVDGGTGVDTLQLSGTDLDLRLVANQAGSHSYGGSRIDGIEIIDMGSADSNTLKLTVFDLIDMGSANTFETTARQQLLVKGGAGDTVQLMDTNATGVWTLASGTVTIGGEQYHVLNHNTAAASLYVKDGVAVTGFVAGAPAAPPPSYISIGRLDADGTAFGAWFDTDQNGVKDAGEVMIEANVHIDMVAENYTYSLKGVDFATGSYTVRFVDVVMHNFDKLDIPGELFSDYAHLDMGFMHFGTDDKVIIDMKTNANDWMGMDVRGAFDPYAHPSSTYGNNTLGVYADGVYGARTSTGLFGQLEAGTRPSDSLSTEDYSRLDIYAQDQMVIFAAKRYHRDLGQPGGGTLGFADKLIDLGVPITTENLEFILPTTFIV